ncbi:MAG: hypothetical protein WBL53_02085 [Pseudonocardiaceae bacterium]
MDYTTVIATRNKQQAAGVSDHTGFVTLLAAAKPRRVRELGETEKIFSDLSEDATKDYISGWRG